MCRESCVQHPSASWFCSLTWKYRYNIDGEIFFAGFSAFNFVCVRFVLDGTNGSSTSTSSASQGGAFNPPNIVMGAFSMPVDVVGATQVCD